ncbi:MAG: response regulator [Chloroflexi bacterium]|nr:MAG: response regulator [Chloroflexota bacterium]
MIRALVVDDDFMVAELHSDFTARVPGFQVVGIAHSGGEALAAIERQRPDLVILDIYLPDQSGLAVLQQLRRDGADVDVIMVTAAKDMPSLQQAMQGGVLHYIVKPFDFARFAQTLETYRRFRDERARRVPKGLNGPTLDLILRDLMRQHAPQTAQEVADRTGVSRGTARRYLEYLEQRGQATLDLRYGSTGRPEHLYELVGEQTPTRPER